MSLNSQEKPQKINHVNVVLNGDITIPRLIGCHLRGKSQANQRHDMDLCVVTSSAAGRIPDPSPAYAMSFPGPFRDGNEERVKKT